MIELNGVKFLINSTPPYPLKNIGWLYLATLLTDAPEITTDIHTLLSGQFVGNQKILGVEYAGGPSMFILFREKLRDT